MHFSLIGLILFFHDVWVTSHICNSFLCLPRMLCFAFCLNNDRRVRMPPCEIALGVGLICIMCLIAAVERIVRVNWAITLGSRGILIHSLLLIPDRACERLPI